MIFIRKKKVDERLDYPSYTKCGKNISVVKIKQKKYPSLWIILFYTFFLFWFYGGFFLSKKDCIGIELKNDESINKKREK